jgi:hypothetical protein
MKSMIFDKALDRKLIREEVNLRRGRTRYRQPRKSQKSEEKRDGSCDRCGLVHRVKGQCPVYKKTC